MSCVWEILVPKWSQGGKGPEIPEEFHNQWDEKIREIAGGITVMKSARGQWVSPSGEIFHDEMIPVRIVCTNNQIHEIMDMTMDHYKDEQSLMCYKVSDCCIFRYRA